RPEALRVERPGTCTISPPCQDHSEADASRGMGVPVAQGLLERHRSLVVRARKVVLAGLKMQIPEALERDGLPHGIAKLTRDRECFLQIGSSGRQISEIAGHVAETGQAGALPDFRSVLAADLERLFEEGLGFVPFPERLGDFSQTSED